MLSSIFVMLNLCHLICAHFGLRLTSRIRTGPRISCVLPVILRRGHLTKIGWRSVFNMVRIGLVLTLVMSRLILRHLRVIIAYTIGACVYLHRLRIA